MKLGAVLAVATMSSTAATKTSTSGKVDVSFATDDEDETSSAEQSESSEDETSSSAGTDSDGDEKSDADGDADDESDMPTFTLSLQPSSGTNDADDALPDLSRSSEKTSQQVVHETTTVKTSRSVVETASSSRSASSATNLEGATSDVTKDVKTSDAERSDTKSVTHDKGQKKEQEQEQEQDEQEEDQDQDQEEEEEEEEEEDDDDDSDEEDSEEEESSSEESAETDSSEEQTDEEKLQDDGKHEDQSQSKTLETKTAAVSSKPVSTAVERKKVTTTTSSSSKVSVTETKIQEVKHEDKISNGKMETKNSLTVEKNVETDELKPSETNSKQIVEGKTKVKSSTKKESVISEETSKLNPDKKEKMPDSSKTAAVETEQDLATETAEVATKSVAKLDSKRRKKKEENESISERTDTTTGDQNSDTKISKAEAADEVKPKKEMEKLETTKKTRKSKHDAEEILQEVKTAVEEKSAATSEKAKSTSKPESTKAKPDIDQSEAVEITPSVSKETSHSKREGSSDEKRDSQELESNQSKKTEDRASKISKNLKSKNVDEVPSKEQGEKDESSKNKKSRKPKLESKETNQEVKSVEEQTSSSASVVTKASPDDLHVKEKQSTEATDTHNDPKLKHNKDDNYTNTSDKPVAATENSITDETQEIVNDTTISEVNKAVPGSTPDTATVKPAHDLSTGDETSEIETSKETPPSKEDAKIDDKVSVITTTDSVESSTSIKDSTGDVDSSENITDESTTKNQSISDTGSKTDSLIESTTAADVELSREKTELDSTEFRLPPAVGNALAGLDDIKLNGVENDDRPPDDAEFRPRRNSIDEFIKRILAEAREEQKKILDSCAVSSETSVDAGVDGSTPAATAEVADITSTLPRRAASEPQQPLIPTVNGLDTSFSTSTSTRKNREDFDIDDELADISRYYAKRSMVDHSNEEETTEMTSTRQVSESTKSQIITNGDDALVQASIDEMAHFVPQRRETTAILVRDSSRPVRMLVDQQTNIIRQLTEASRSIDDLDNEVRQLRQSSGSRNAVFASVGNAIREEIRLYEMELAAFHGRMDQQRLPGGGHFVREQFMNQCAAEFLHRSTTTNGPRLDRMDDWSRIGRRRSGSFSAASVDDDIGPRSVSRHWGTVERDPADWMAQYRHSRAGSVASDRGYSSIDAPDEARATSSSLLSRLTAFNGSAGPADYDVSRSSRASSEAPRNGYQRSQTSYTDEWVSSGGAFHSSSINPRQYSATYSHDSTDGNNGELDTGYRFSATRPPTYPRYQPISIETTTTTSSSRLYARRGSLQGYSSYDSWSGGNDDAGHSFNSRFLSRIREKKALGETTTRQTSSDRPFRSRFLKSSSASQGASTTYSTSRSPGLYEESEEY